VGKSGFVKPLETLPPMVSNGETKSSEKSSVVGKKKALAVFWGKIPSKPSFLDIVGQ